MPAHARRQYTLRNIPDAVDRILRRRAKESGKSFNEVAVAALSAGAGTGVPRRDLSEIAGSLTAKEADLIDREIRAQRRVDAKAWR